MQRSLRHLPAALAITTLLLTTVPTLPAAQQAATRDLLLEANEHLQLAKQLMERSFDEAERSCKRARSVLDNYQTTDSLRSAAAGKLRAQVVQQLDQIRVRRTEVADAARIVKQHVEEKRLISAWTTWRDAKVPEVERSVAPARAVLLRAIGERNERLTRAQNAEADRDYEKARKLYLSVPKVDREYNIAADLERLRSRGTRRYREQ